MKKRRFKKAQIIGILKPAEPGLPALDMCQQNGISETTFCKWRVKYGGMEASEAMRLKQLKEEENPKLKKMVVDSGIDNQNFQRGVLHRLHLPSKVGFASYPL